MKSIGAFLNAKGGLLYQQKLKDDRWVSYARNIKERNGNRCSVCKSEKHLNVHHSFYDAGREPWEYDNSEVMVLCNSCHREFHAEINKFRQYCMTLLTPNSLRVINGAFAVGLRENDPLQFAHAVAEFASNPGIVKRYAEAWNKGWSGRKPPADTPLPNSLDPDAIQDLEVIRQRMAKFKQT